MNLLEIIQDLSQSRGLTIAEIERKANLGNGTIRRWGNSIPSADKLFRVSKVLGVSIEYLLTGEEPPEGEKVKMIARKVSKFDDKDLNNLLNFIDIYEKK